MLKETDIQAIELTTRLDAILLAMNEYLFIDNTL